MLERHFGGRHVMHMGRFRIGTKITLILCAISVLASAAVGLSTYWQFSRALIDQELKQLSGLAEVKAVRFTAEMRALRADALFIARSPVVRGLVDAQRAHGISPKTGETERVLRDRMAVVFEELLRANPSYYQARLIGVADGGREIVRVDRDSPDGPVRVVAERALQRKGREPYFPAGLKLADGTILLTDVNLNREHGRIAEPRTPVIRAASPIFGSDGKPVAIFVINVFFEPIVEALHAGLTPGQALFVTNDRGDYLVHPDAARTYGFDYGHPIRIQDDYPKMSTIFNLQEAATAAIVSKVTSGDRLAIGAARTSFDPDNPNRFVTVAVATLYDDAVTESRKSRDRSLAAAAVVLLIAVACGYFVSRSVTKPLRIITASAGAFGRGQTNAALPTERTDEIGVLARALSGMMAQVRTARADLDAGPSSWRNPGEPPSSCCRRSKPRGPRHCKRSRWHVSKAPASKPSSTEPPTRSSPLTPKASWSCSTTRRSVFLVIRPRKWSART